MTVAERRQSADPVRRYCRTADWNKSVGGTEIPFEQGKLGYKWRHDAGRYALTPPSPKKGRAKVTPSI
ncbi:MAG: hypothetical protein WBW08_05140, partial [Methyloceanibacter sp.]